MHPGHGARAADPKVVGSEDALPPVQEPWLITGGGGGGGGGRGVNPQLVVHGGGVSAVIERTRNCSLARVGLEGEHVDCMSGKELLALLTMRKGYRKGQPANSAGVWQCRVVSSTQSPSHHHQRLREIAQISPSCDRHQ